MKARVLVFWGVGVSGRGAFGFGVEGISLRARSKRLAGNGASTPSAGEGASTLHNGRWLVPALADVIGFS